MIISRQKIQIQKEKCYRRGLPYTINLLKKYIRYYSQKGLIKRSNKNMKIVKIFFLKFVIKFVMS